MEPAVAGSAAVTLVAVLVALGVAYHLASSAGAALLVEREGRHAAERALDARVLAEAQDRAGKLVSELEALHARSVAAGQGGHADLVALARLAAPARPGAAGPDDAGLLSAFASATAPGGDPRPAAGGASAAGGPVGAAVAGDGRGLAPGRGGAAG